MNTHKEMFDSGNTEVYIVVKNKKTGEISWTLISNAVGVSTTMDVNNEETFNPFENSLYTSSSKTYTFNLEVTGGTYKYGTEKE